MQFPKKFFVTGTDTGIGKTVVSAILCQGLKASYWKPIQSGAEDMTDTEWVKKHTSLPDSHFFPEKYCLQKPLSPHAAASIENVTIDLDDLILPNSENFPHFIIEGCGGLLVPLNANGDYIVDLIDKWHLPVIVVSRSCLGTINHTLMTLSILRDYKLEILGVVLNGPKNMSNRLAIEKYGKVKVIGEIEHQGLIDSDTLQYLFKRIIL